MKVGFAVYLVATLTTASQASDVFLSKLVEQDSNDPAKAVQTVCNSDFPVIKTINVSLNEPFWIPNLKQQLLLEPFEPAPLRDISIVTLFSLERLKPLQVQCQEWPGTVVAALYIPLLNGTVRRAEKDASGLRPGAGLNETLQFVRALHKSLQTEHNGKPRGGRCRMRLAVYSEDIPDDSVWYSYPVNALRNRALAMAETDLVLLLDGDFIPGPRLFVDSLFNEPLLHSAVMGLTRAKGLLVLNAIDGGETAQAQEALDKQQAVVKEVLQSGTKAKLRQRAAEGSVAQFQPHGHMETNWTRWLAAESLYTVRYNSTDPFRPSRYEPYFIGMRSLLPWYDERYRGYHYNKMSFTYQLNQAKFVFHVHPFAFVAHWAHESKQPQQMNDFYLRLAALYYADVPHKYEWVKLYEPYVNDPSVCGKGPQLHKAASQEL